MKKWWLLILTLLFITISVTAFSKEQSINWVKNNLNTQTSTIEETSFALLSLGLNNEIEATSTDYTIFQQRKDPLLEFDSSHPLYLNPCSNGYRESPWLPYNRGQNNDPEFFQYP